ncbi:hypothetical protein [Leptospira neocaledonica]|uniref:Uncharacterized protein n=1 Tax=Leptospira neocaledonica TaxID=2023192 RepID=A0A2N0A1B0_9LEPT|nr:hypothetical protein [Leptospira neocaledonica]PJZ77991.1 hypothetical protein CH365_06090 [Leptospira neocaledonica]
MKEHLHKLTILFVISVSSYCLVQQEYYEEKDKSDPSKIYYKDAQVLLIAAVNGLALRCETFAQSGFNYGVSYLALTGESCTEPQLVKGCTEYHYLNEKEVYQCTALIFLDPCDVTSDSPPRETEAAQNYRFATFGICAGAFRSKMAIPLFL